MGLSAGLGASRAGTGRGGIAQIRQGWPPPGPRGQNMDGRIILALLAEAYGKVGQAEEGLTVLAEALDMVDKTGERYYEAELYRLRAS